MEQLVNVLIAIYKVHIIPQSALDCRPGLGRLNNFMGQNIPLPLLKVFVAYITCLVDVQLGISLTFY